MNLERIGGLYAERLKIPKASFQRATMVGNIQKAQATDKQKLVDEAESAKAERDMLKATLLALDGTEKAERDALRAENERLREALQSVDKELEFSEYTEEGFLRSCVRAALRPTEGEVKP